MAFDYKKEYKEFYMPKNKPSIVEIPKMNYIAVRGTGNPNEENGDYKKTIGLLYGVAYTIKMSYKGTHKIDGFLNMSFHHSFLSVSEHQNLVGVFNRTFAGFFFFVINNSRTICLSTKR